MSGIYYVIASKKVTVGEGYRESYKQIKSKGNKTRFAESMSIPVPVMSDGVISLIAQHPRMQEWLRGQVESLQDAHIWNIVLNGGKDFVTSNDLSVDALVEFASTTTSAQRWSAALIEAWFSDCMVAPLEYRLVSKGLGGKEVLKQVQLYRELFVSLSAKKPVLTDANRTRLVNALGLIDDAGSEDPRTIRIALAVENAGSPENVGIVDLL